MPHVLENTSNNAVVETAINVVCAYHEVQLKKYQALLDNNTSPEFQVLLAQYQMFLETHDSAETAFSAFLQYLSE